MDPHTLGALAGHGLLATVSVAALVVATRLWRRSPVPGPGAWLAVRLAATVLLFAFALVVGAFGLEQPAGGPSDLFVLSTYVLFGAVFLLDVPLHLTHPHRAGVMEDHGWLPWSLLGLPLLGVAYLLFTWPGRAPVTLSEARGDESLMATWRAWSNRYDVVEDAAIWGLVASLAVAIVALLVIQGWRALRGGPRSRRTARRMLVQASLGPVAWLVAGGVVAAVGMAGVSSMAAGLSFASGLLFEPAVPASFLLLGPILWGRDLLEEGPAPSTVEVGRAANPS